MRTRRPPAVSRRRSWCGRRRAGRRSARRPAGRRGAPDRHDDRRQMIAAGQAGPEQHVVVGDRAAVHRVAPLPGRALLHMRQGRRWTSADTAARPNPGRTPPRRGEARRCSFRPSQVRCGMSTQRVMIASALMSSGDSVASGLALLRQEFLGVARAPGGVQQLQVQMERLGGVERRARGAADRGALAFQTVRPGRPASPTVPASVSCPGSCVQTAMRMSFRPAEARAPAGSRPARSPPGSGPAITDSAASRSAAERAIGPITAMSVAAAALVAGSP